MPFIASYTSSYKARHSRATDAWTPDGGVYRATSGLSFWIDASDTSSYTTNTTGLTSVTDKAGGNAITINNSGNVNDVQPQAFDNQNGVPSSMHVFEFGAESFTTGDFAQVDSDGNHFSIALVRAGDDGPSNPYGAGFSSFWSLENNDSGILASGIKRDYGLELGSGSYFYGQLALDSIDLNQGRINNDDVVQYGGIYSDPNVNTDQNLLRFDGFGNNTNYRARSTWFIMAIVFNKTGNQILVRIDGENAFTPVDYDNKLNTNLSVRIAANRLSDNLDTSFHCQVAEFMTFAAPPGTGGTDMSEVERLEGYLAHKWSVNSLLPTTHPYKNYSLASTGDWNPAQGFPTDSGTMNTAFWLDASDEDTWSYNSTNGHIDSITDKSGNSTLSIDDNTKIWRGSSFAGNYYFMLQGNTGISTTSTIAQADNGNHWAIGLMRWDNIDNDSDAFWHLSSNDGTNKDYAVESRNSFTSAGWAGQTDFGSFQISSDSGGEINWTSGSSNHRVGHNVWSIIAVYFNKTGNQIGARINGTNAHSPVNDYDNSISTNQEVHLFKGRLGNFLHGDLAEFFTFADIPGTGGTDISFIEIAEGYLAHKWNGHGLSQDMVNKLPNDHPFKNSAP